MFFAPINLYTCLYDEQRKNERQVVFFMIFSEKKMYLKYYLNDDGKRVYTLKSVAPDGRPTLSAHPARFSPGKLKTLSRSSFEHMTFSRWHSAIFKIQWQFNFYLHKNGPYQNILSKPSLEPMIFRWQVQPGAHHHQTSIWIASDPAASGGALRRRLLLQYYYCTKKVHDCPSIVE